MTLESILGPGTANGRGKKGRRTGGEGYKGLVWTRGVLSRGHIMRQKVHITRGDKRNEPFEDL